MVLTLLTLPMFVLMVRDQSQFSTRWLALFVCIVCLSGIIFSLSYPVREFPEGIWFGINGVFSLVWLVVGSQMIKRYLFLI